MSRVWQVVRKGNRHAPEAGKTEDPRRVEAPEVIGGVLDTYRVPAGGTPESSAEVFVVEEDGVGRYLVRPPKLSQKESEVLELLKINLLDSVPLQSSGDTREIIADYVWRSAEDPGLDPIVRECHGKLVYYLMKEFSGFWEVDPLLQDDDLEEISVSRFDKPVRVLHRKFSEYMFMETDITYPTEERLQAFIRRLAQFGGTTVSLAQPSLEVTLHGPSDRRVTATLGDEISRPGSTYAIRKQREDPITLAQLAAPEPARWPVALPNPIPDLPPTYEEVHSHKTLSVLMAAYFWLLLERTTNVLIAGETNSGKTTLMNAILALANPKSKIVTAEDVLEINLPDHLHWQRLKTRSYRAGLSPAASRFSAGRRGGPLHNPGIRSPDYRHWTYKRKHQPRRSEVPNGTVCLFQVSAVIASGGREMVQELIPSGVCSPGTATCMSKFEQIVSGNPVGSSVGVVTSFGNTFWYSHAPSQVSWSSLIGFPEGCPSGQAVNKLNSTLTCGAGGTTAARVKTSTSTVGTGNYVSTTLTAALSANTSYVFFAFTAIEPANGVEDYNFEVHPLPAGAVLLIACSPMSYPTAGGNQPTNCVTEAGTPIAAANSLGFGVSPPLYATPGLFGSVIMGAAAGTLQIDFACTANCGSLTLKAGSFMIVQSVA